MDCVIPGHGVRPFSHAVSCLCKIGKELYIDFDPLDGLTIRTLNDAKSAFASFHFDPHFFERCSSPPTATNAVSDTNAVHANSARKSISPSSSYAASSRRRRRTAKKQRRGSSTGKDAADETRGRRRSPLAGEEMLYSIRVPLRTVNSILRSRKGVRSLRIRSSNVATTTSIVEESAAQEDSQGDEDNDLGPPTALMQLCLEFKIESPSYPNSLMRIVHRIGVADCDSVTAVAPKDNCSEIITIPAVIGRLLDPLKRTSEMALTINDTAKISSASSFHHADAAAASSARADNAILSAASSYVLKTETSMGCDEYEEYNWRNDRIVAVGAGNNDSEDEGEGDNDKEDDDEHGCKDAPSNVNEEVTLVFSIKEVKALLQFCSQAVPNEEMAVIVSFEWGGRPVIFDTEGDAFTGSLIMATLDHRLLGRRSAASDNPN